MDRLSNRLPILARTICPVIEELLVVLDIFADRQIHYYESPLLLTKAMAIDVVKIEYVMNVRKNIVFQIVSKYY